MWLFQHHLWGCLIPSSSSFSTYSSAIKLLTLFVLFGSGASSVVPFWSMFSAKSAELFADDDGDDDMSRCGAEYCGGNRSSSDTKLVARRRLLVWPQILKNAPLLLHHRAAKQIDTRQTTRTRRFLMLAAQHSLTLFWGRGGQWWWHRVPEAVRTTDITRIDPKRRN